MEDETRRENEIEHRAQLFNELLANINRQLEMDIELKELMELLFKKSTKSTKVRQVQEKVEAVKELFIEAESVQAEGRAIFHQLFGTDYDY
jgi:hypothetical protein